MAVRVCLPAFAQKVFHSQSGRWACESTTLDSLIRFAHKLDQFRLIAPSWMGKEA
jgi:hypothetical protein